MNVKLAYYNVADAAQRMRVSEDTIRDAIHEGRLIAKRISDKPRAPFLIREDALDEWFDGLVDA